MNEIEDIYGAMVGTPAGISKQEEDSLRAQSLSGVLRKDVSIETLAASIRHVARERSFQESPIPSARSGGKNRNR